MNERSKLPRHRAYAVAIAGVDDNESFAHVRCVFLPERPDRYFGAQVLLSFMISAIRLSGCPDIKADAGYFTD
jgi:hypothetical protein